MIDGDDAVDATLTTDEHNNRAPSSSEEIRRMGELVSYRVCSLYAGLKDLAVNASTATKQELLRAC